MPEKPGAKNSTKLDRCSVRNAATDSRRSLGTHEDKSKQLTVVNSGERWSPVAGPRRLGNDCSWPFLSVRRNAAVRQLSGRRRRSAAAANTAMPDPNRPNGRGKRHFVPPLLNVIRLTYRLRRIGITRSVGLC